MMMDADAQAQANAILRSLSAPQARSAVAAASGLSDAQIAGLLAGNVDAAQLVNSIVNGGILPSMPAPQRPPHRSARSAHILMCPEVGACWFQDCRLMLLLCCSLLVSVRPAVILLLSACMRVWQLLCA